MSLEIQVKLTDLSKLIYNAQGQPLTRVGLQRFIWYQRVLWKKLMIHNWATLEESKSATSNRGINSQHHSILELQKGPARPLRTTPSSCTWRTRGSGWGDKWLCQDFTDMRARTKKLSCWLHPSHLRVMLLIAMSTPSTFQNYPPIHWAQKKEPEIR